MQLDNLYQEVILDHYKHPENKGLAAAYDAQVHHINPSCGDEITLNLTLDGSIVQSVSWDGLGCSISQASVSIMSGLMIGKKLDDAQVVFDNFVQLMQSKGSGQPDESILEDAVALAGVSQYPARIKCALLGWMAFKDASVQAQKKN
ncbi:nitrogen fixation protein NifU and related proteins [Candidatus Planktophila limnetica]|jgi:nitrogen fixation NifU-like protein|uniref:Nitrogen fixation protein NifU and related proteins n=1 Tax=Candidatus Planktophila limnetica TaxID=573600 RepID=A0A249LFU9_9ACTN|nr:SUF system NifU family Fe-S cluster assembly protein [Candidatus Planktophila limnetica]ASY27765.1 nitrogen fixation protein NifU and related proteins [Candidatus Planktophila limnetica]